MFPSASFWEANLGQRLHYVPFSHFQRGKSWPKPTLCSLQPLSERQILAKGYNMFPFSLVLRGKSWPKATICSLQQFLERQSIAKGYNMFPSATFREASLGQRLQYVLFSHFLRGQSWPETTICFLQAFFERPILAKGYNMFLSAIFGEANLGHRLQYVPFSHF